MPAGKMRFFPTPGSHPKCRECEISLICISGRRKFGDRHWCDRCRGVYYADLGKVVRCVVFRNKRGRYSRNTHCPVCDPNRAAASNYWSSAYRTPSYSKPKGPPTVSDKIVEGLTHEDAKAWFKEQGG
jgi:hypothetical protein